MISSAKIHQVKEAADILEVISDFVTLKKRGKDFFGLSPFTNERTPSFTVSPAKKFYKCFSSGKGGDVIDFVMQHLSLPYQEAVGYLAKKYHIDVNSQANYIIPERKAYVEPPASYIPMVDVKPSLGHPQGNNLYNYLLRFFPAELIEQRFAEYLIGTKGDWCIFWQVDISGRVRSGKYIKYKRDGHRDKDAKTSWHHNATREYKPLYPNFNLQQCLFGEHLVPLYPRRPVAIVESEKTALVASLFIDKYTWVSCGMKGGLNAAKLAALRNRSVTLFPDLNAYEEWSLKAKEFGFNISNHIEHIASNEDRLKGLDLADFLLR